MPNGGALQGMKLRGDHPVVLEHPEWWIEDPETAALAAAIVEALRPSSPIGHEEEPEPASTRGDLPGGFIWETIEATYRLLAATPTATRHRRRYPHEPSRPEVASELLTSPATLKRACKAAGKGSTWPPKGL